MITLAYDDFRAVLAEVRLAPSVHNVQPSRWHHSDRAIELLGEPRRSIPVADPEWRDWRLSHGAALEGFAIALAGRGLKIGDLQINAPNSLSPESPCQTIARVTLANLEHRSALEPTATRVSWRGAFRPSDEETRAALNGLAAARDDLMVLTQPAVIADAAVLGDRAGLFFLRDTLHRRELLEWLRLAKSHAYYQRDGLNAEAMALSGVEAWGAGLVLGPLFTALDRIGLAAPLVAERAKTNTAAAIVLFHRPKGEDAVVSGRAFYRAWLEMERQGLKGCPMSVLADWSVARDALAAKHAVPEDRHIISVFRIGCPNGQPKLAHARLPVDELIV
jgi:nitroreductase